MSPTSVAHLSAPASFDVWGIAGVKRKVAAALAVFELAKKHKTQKGGSPRGGLFCFLLDMPRPIHDVNRPGHIRRGFARQEYTHIRNLIRGCKTLGWLLFSDEILDGVFIGEPLLLGARLLYRNDDKGYPK
jgi:hypothetical protein